MEDSIQRIVRQMADGQPVDWDTVTPDSQAAAQALRGLKVIDTISRLARAERRAISDLTNAPSPGIGPSRRRTAEGSANRVWERSSSIERIGEGSYGEVYRAHDPALQTRRRAQAVVPAVGRRRPTSSRSSSEARTLARIRHPNVLSVFGAARHDGRVGMWTELLHGETLEDSLEQPRAVRRGRGGRDRRRAVPRARGRPRRRTGPPRREDAQRHARRGRPHRAHGLRLGGATPPRRARDRDGPFLPVGTPLTMAPEQLAGRRDRTGRRSVRPRRPALPAGERPVSHRGLVAGRAARAARARPAHAAPGLAPGSALRVPRADRAQPAARSRGRASPAREPSSRRWCTSSSPTRAPRRA